MRFVPLDKLINLHDGYTCTFKIDHHQLLLLQRDGQRYLVDAVCPHREHPLDAALVSGGVIQCAAHHYRFSLADGRLLENTEEPCGGLRIWELVYEGNEIGVVIDDQSI
ncbi:Rieske (2Fe-2S) protein [Halioglobus maricola]|uniref:Rieske (2Fe-2S) protein n=1 Tax=Halioglobus maricola TaxID=2601894 RepID=A0A5P9NJR1_9GAMM|nr:Rieske (2Fe-2S) protein [Halioglobus maricola]QFU76007.1 Rieske (2Fe-2S) protein [Halioglobus maricola]